MLYQVATCGILPYDIAIPLRPFSTCRGIEFRRALVEVIDFDHQIVKCDTGDIAYDFLIVALGSTTNYFGNTSAGRHALPVKSLEEGLAIRNRVIDALERATVASVYEARQRLLTFMVIGGGATGVETAGALADAVQHLIPRDYPALHGTRARVIVMEAGSKLLGHMSQQMADAAHFHASGAQLLEGRAAARDTGAPRKCEKPGGDQEHVNGKESRQRCAADDVASEHQARDRVTHDGRSDRLLGPDDHRPDAILIPPQPLARELHQQPRRHQERAGQPVQFARELIGAGQKDADRVEPDQRLQSSGSDRNRTQPIGRRVRSHVLLPWTRVRRHSGALRGS
jgi:hypothetical protein